MNPYTGEFLGADDSQTTLVRWANTFHGHLNNDSVTASLPAVGALWDRDKVMHDYVVGDSTLDLAGLVLEPNSCVDLVPGGRHLMLEGLVEPLVEGDTFELVLTFREAGEVRLVVEVATNDPNG